MATGKLKIGKSAVAAIWAALGLAAMGTWMNLVGYSSAFDPIFLGEGVSPHITRYAFYSGLIICRVAMMVFSDYLERIKVHITIGICVLFCLGTIAFGTAPVQGLFDPLLLSLGGCFVCGISYSWLIVAFYLSLVQQYSLKVAIVAVAASLLLETLLALFFNILFEKPVQVLIGALLPLCVCLIFLYVNRQAKEPLEEQQYELRSNIGRYQILILILSSFTLVSMRGITTVGLWGNIRSDFSFDPFMFTSETIVACIFFLAFSYFALIRRSAAPIQSRYQFGYFVMIVGFIVFLVSGFAFPESEISGERILASSIELFGHLFNWSIVMSSAKLLKVSPYKVFGFSGVLYNFLAIIWMIFLENALVASNAVVAVVVAAIIFCLIVVPVQLFNQREDNLEQLCKRIAQDYALTAREEEVLFYLAQGRSRPFIQEKLSIASGTVKTHSSHIYEKLNIHSRQDLLDMIEREQHHSA